MAVSRASSVVITSVIFTAISLLSVIARLVSRLVVLKNGGRDEIAVVVAMVFAIALLGGTIGETNHGFGRHNSTLSDKESKELMKYVYVTIIFYHTALPLTKASIILQYLRVFPGEKFRKACWITLVAIMLYELSAVLCSIFTCVPVAGFWDLSIPSHCVNIEILYFFHAAFGILTDFVIMFLPMPMLASLKLPRRQKICLMLLFALGGFVCIISILRLYALYQSLNTTDRSYAIGTVIWSNLEINVGIICASLPTIRPLLNRLFPRIFPSWRSQNATGTSQITTRSDFQASRFSNGPPIRLSDLNDDPGSMTHGADRNMAEVEKGHIEDEYFTAGSVVRHVENKSDSSSDEGFIFQR